VTGIGGLVQSDLLLSESSLELSGMGASYRLLKELENCVHVETHNCVDVLGAHSKLTIAVNINTATDTSCNTFKLPQAVHRLTICNIKNRWTVITRMPTFLKAYDVCHTLLALGGLLKQAHAFLEAQAWQSCAACGLCI